ncbi:MAG: nitrate ABC transporter, permease protein, partial [Mesorhizobium sp.]
MSIQTIEDTKVKAFPAKPGKVIAFTAKARRRIDVPAIAGRLATALIPPAVVIAILLVVWQVACSSPTASLPPPSQVWNEAYDLIAHPFFDNGPQD